MAEIYIDLRNNAARLIVAEGSTLSHAHFPDTPINDPGQLSDLMTRVKAGSGGDFSRAHLIIPTDEVMVSFHKTQALEIADARMIIKRAVVADTGDDDPLFRLTRMAAEQNQQVYLAEYVSRVTIEKYISMFHKAGLKLITVTSDLQANQTLFPTLHGEIHRVQAIFDLGQNSMGAYFFSPTEFMWYEFTSGREDDGETPENLSSDQVEDQERSDRRRVYESMNNLHNLYSRFMNTNPEASVEKIWLSGSESSMGGIADAITEGMGVDAELLVRKKSANLRDGHAYAALAGFIKMVEGKRAVNFIPAELQKSFRLSSSLVCLAIGVIYLVALFSGFMIIERNYRNLQDSLETEKNSLALLKSSKSIRGVREDIYGNSRK